MLYLDGEIRFLESINAGDPGGPLCGATGHVCFENGH